MNIINSERQKSFWISVNMAVMIYRRKDKDYQHPEECILVDIGAGGVCVNSKYQYAENEILCLLIKLENFRTVSLLGQVIHITEIEPAQYRYGILFSQVWDNEQIYLNRILDRMSI